jgi:hypothetical protein
MRFSDKEAGGAVQHPAEQIGKPHRRPIAGGRLGFVLGIVLLLAAGLGYMDRISLGFPDGHLTAFERETSSLRFGALIANSFFGLLGLVYGFASGFGWIRQSRVMTLVLVLAFAAIALPSVMLPGCADLQACVQIYQIVTGHEPDDGHGG